jgi:hypothetical protein
VKLYRIDPSLIYYNNICCDQVNVTGEFASPIIGHDSGSFFQWQVSGNGVNFNNIYDANYAYYVPSRPISIRGETKIKLFYRRISRDTFYGTSPLFYNKISNVVSVEFLLNTNRMKEKEDETEQSLDISPNPFSSNININSSTDISGYSLEIYDVTGKVILNQSKLDGFLNIVDTSYFKSGFYLLVLSSPENRIVKKIIKN